MDFEKAFNIFDWEFLFQLLEKLNFNEAWINRIATILKSPELRLLDKGSPTREFISRGICQGDPLSPFVFNLVEEVLHLLLVKGELIGIFKGFVVNNSGFTNLAFTICG